MVEFKSRRRLAAGDDTQLRFRLRIESALAALRGEPLFEVYQAWERWPAMADGTRLDTLCGDGLAGVPEEARRFISIVDVSAREPEQFQYLRHRTPADFGNVEGLHFLAFPSMMMRLASEVDFFDTKTNRYLAIDEVHHWRTGQRDMERHYIRLTCPLCDPDGAITRILIASSKLETGNVVPLSNLSTPLLVD